MSNWEPRFAGLVTGFWLGWSLLLILVVTHVVAVH